MASQRMILWYAAVATLWLLCAAVASEVFLRFQFVWRSKHNHLVQEEIGRRVSLIAAFDESLWDVPWWSYKKNVEVSTEYKGRTCQIRMNNRGFRGKDITLPKPPGVFRIVCVGGSTTVEGWTDDTTYPAILEQTLAREFGPGAVEVINCGISSLSSAGEVQKASEYLALQPDLLIEYGCINDLSILAPRSLNKLRLWQRLAGRSRLLSALLNPWLVPPTEEMARLFRRYVIPNQIAMEEACQRESTRIAFCSFATPEPDRLTSEQAAFLDFDIRVDWNAANIGLFTYNRWVGVYNHVIQETCIQKGWLYIPVAEEMPGGMEDFNDFCHMTDSGIARKAEIIARHIRSVVADGVTDQR